MARRTKEDALATRDALLDAAERVFGRRGVARTSLAQIAEEAGLTRGAVYWHFKDKADLFTAMMDTPLNGAWTMRVTDLWGADNGFMFGWTIAFDPTLINDCSGPIVL